MEQKIIEMALAQGLWAVLFVSLFFYVLKENAKREDKLFVRLEELSKCFQDLSKSVCGIEEDVEDLKDRVKK